MGVLLTGHNSNLPDLRFRGELVKEWGLCTEERRRGTLMLQDGRCRPGFVPLARPSLQLTLVCRAAAWRYMRVARMRGETIYRPSPP